MANDHCLSSGIWATVERHAETSSSPLVPACYDATTGPRTRAESWGIDAVGDHLGASSGTFRHSRRIGAGKRKLPPIWRTRPQHVFSQDGAASGDAPGLQCVVDGDQSGNSQHPRRHPPYCPTLEAVTVNQVIPAPFQFPGHLNQRIGPDRRRRGQGRLDSPDRQALAQLPNMAGDSTTVRPGHVQYLHFHPPVPTYFDQGGTRYTWAIALREY